MKARSRLVVIAMTSLVAFAVTDPVLRADEPPATLKMTSQAWTLREAKAQFRLNPHDAYLQYVTLQLARQVNRPGEIAQQIGSGRQRTRRGGRRDQVDLFKIFSGALAVQESLQLDTMTQNDGRKTNQARTIDVSTLTGPTVKSHPWKTMLAGREPKVSPLSLFVPEDQYFMAFKSLNKLLDVLDLNDRWGAHVIIQTKREARNHRVSERLKTQLAVKTD